MRFWYNPPAFSWASRPMAEVGGAPFSELVARLVFAPAGMTRSARKHRRLELPPALAAELAVPYHTDSAGRLVRSPPPPPQGDGAAGGVVSTVLDLARFDVALAEGRLLTPESLRLMWTQGRSPSGAALPYGIGWFVKEHAGERLLWHTGLWEGAYSALYLKVPQRRLTLILLANSDGLRWEAGLDEAAVERSPFATAFLAAFPR
jgi:CubicO group peptidase (beta-lactamase class C family)